MLSSTQMLSFRSRPLVRQVLSKQNVRAASVAKALNIDTMNANMKHTRYEVRGEIYHAAQKRLKEGKEVIALNIGNPHSLGQKPLTFNRQVLSLLLAPFLLEDASVRRNFPEDVIIRAERYLKEMKGGLGAYSDSKGLSVVREEVAQFLAATSGQPADPEHIFLSNGASDVAKLLLNSLIRSPNDGILVPIPQYPLYSATIALYGGSLVPYYLNESAGWGLDIPKLRDSIRTARSNGITVRALVLINPGNPTGQCLSDDQLRQVLDICREYNLILMADEVYQENIYRPGITFTSARRALGTATDVEVASFHSTSKGFTGECGLRGGYMEVKNFAPEVVDELYKISSVSLCPNLVGQVATGLMVNPPKPGDPSYELYHKEKTDRLSSLARRAKLLTDALNGLEGVSCQAVEGAMYAFPSVTFPLKAVERAAALGKNPDVLYCLELLQETGLSCVPGSGFQQAPGTFHFRTTILPPEESFPDIIQRFARFHEGFMKRYK
jgi:glutamate--glyoxylate aminotransferase